MGIQTEWIQYGDDQQFSGFIAKSDYSKEPAPGIIVIQEIWGVEEHIQEVTRRFAEAGYTAIAPDLFAIGGQKPETLSMERVKQAKSFLDTLPPTEWGNPEKRTEALSKLPEEEQAFIGSTLGAIFNSRANIKHYMEQLHATTFFLREHNESTVGKKVGIVGFCLGGALSGMMACQDPQLGGVVIFYGNAPQNEQIPQIQCPVLGLYGELDKRITDEVPAFAAAMKENGKDFTYHIYENAPHAFFNDSRISFRVDAAKAAFIRTLDFFKQNTHEGVTP